MSKINYIIKQIFKSKSIIYDYNILIYIKTTLNYNIILTKNILIMILIKYKIIILPLN